MKELRRKKVILMDWDDTVVNTFHPCVDLYARFAREHNLPIPTELDIATLWGTPLEGVITGLWKNRPAEKLIAQYLKFVKETEFCIKPFDYSEESLLRLKKLGFHLGIISTGARFSIENTLRLHLILPKDFFIHIQGGDDHHIHKPDPRVFDPVFAVLKKHNLSEKDSLYIGDSLHDLLAAYTRGIPFVALTTGLTSNERFMQEGVKNSIFLTHFSHL